MISDLDRDIATGQVMESLDQAADRFITAEQIVGRYSTHAEDYSRRYQFDLGVEE